MHNRTLFFGSICLKQGRHFGYWNQPLNMCMLVCYLDSHESGLCCYLVIHSSITSILAILLPFTTCLLTFPHIMLQHHNVKYSFIFSQP
jgi:hypothetical protein